MMAPGGRICQNVMTGGVDVSTVPLRPSRIEDLPVYAESGMEQYHAWS